MKHTSNFAERVMWRCVWMIVMLVGTAIPTDGQATEFQLPPFLPAYYAPAFQIDGARIYPIDSRERNGVEECVYATENRRFSISVGRMRCDRTRCLDVFNNLQGHLSKEAESKEVTILELTGSELAGRIREQGTETYLFAYILPGSTVIWTYSSIGKECPQMTAMFKTILSFANRQRYEQAFPDNIEMGHWGPQIHEYARQLTEEGKKREALQVLRRLIATSPFDFNAHIDLTEMTDDAKEAKNSAGIVLKNSEDPALISKAAKRLGVQEPKMESLPFISSKEKGLQVILVPLLPCNVKFLQEAAAVYKQITKIPVKIRRLRNDWSLRPPERIFRQRDVQSFLVQAAKRPGDFRGWDKDRYVKALQETADSQDPISSYYIRALIDDIKKKPGQHEVDPYLDWFCEEIKTYRSADPRTMYVGVTEVNIFSGDGNFVFSVHKNTPGMQASILSYSMMLAKTLYEKDESRPRLVERIAKELVPASLKTLGIPRSTDPKCPYSYSSGVDRLDQKGLVLSEQVKKEIKKLR